MSCSAREGLMPNSVEPDQLASLEASLSQSTLFAKAGHMLVQQDHGKT